MPQQRSAPSRGARGGAARYGTSLLKAVQVLDAFEPRTELGASELGEAIGADRSTAFRLAQALTRCGWLCQDPESKRYRLGIRLWELGTMAIADVDVRRAAHPHMQQLAATTGESSDLGILDGSGCVYIERVEGYHGVRVFARIGMRVPAHTIAMGKVLLAYLSTETRRDHLSLPLCSHTPRTLTSLEDLDKQCEKILVDQYATNLGEWRPDVGGIASPVFDRLGRCVAAVSIDLPLSRLTPGSIRNLAPLVRRAAAAASRDSGADLVEVGYSSV